MSELDDLRARVRVQAEQIAALQEAAKKLIRWVVIVTRPVADYGPANDERCQVDARCLYHLMQTADLLRKALALVEGCAAPAEDCPYPASSDEQEKAMREQRDAAERQSAGLLECPECHALQPTPGKCWRCPGTVAAPADEEEK